MTSLPFRRHCLRYPFEHRGFKFFGTIGIHPDSFKACDIFLQVAGKAKSGSYLEAVIRDAAVGASMALQHGATVEQLRSSMTRLDNDAPAGPVAAILDIYATDQARAG